MSIPRCGLGKQTQPTSERKTPSASWQPHVIPLVHLIATALCLSPDDNLLTVDSHSKWCATMFHQRLQPTVGGLAQQADAAAPNTAVLTCSVCTLSVKTTAGSVWYTSLARAGIIRGSRRRKRERSNMVCQKNMIITLNSFGGC